MIRRTVIVEEKLVARELRLHAARDRAHGLQAMTMEQAAARLAGGLLSPIDQDSLRLALQAALPHVNAGSLAAIRDLPGTAGAIAASLRKAWLAGVEPSSAAGRHPRLAELAELEHEALAQLPAGMLRPRDLVERALARINHAPTVLGAIELHGMCDLEPCWRPLLLAIADVTAVTWQAGPRNPPEWLEGTRLHLVQSEPETPDLEVVSAGSERHEVTEALRWARRLVADGAARPEEIAITAADTASYDELVLAVRRDSNLNLAFADGVPALATRDGQAAAALADIMTRGLNQPRMRRLAALAGSGGMLARLPLGWQRLMPPDALLDQPADWRRLLDRLKSEDWPEGRDGSADLATIIDLLQQGPAGATEIGETVLEGGALSIWRGALRRGGPNGIEGALAEARVEDEHDPCACIAWMRAAILAASPRPFAWLLGLSSASWPRRSGEDPIIPHHVIPSSELEPTPRCTADRLHFDAIIAGSARSVMLSRPRRDGQGRILGPSALLRARGPEGRLRRDRRPEHAFSETDRLTGRPSEFGETAAARSGERCWRNWSREDLTPHDGMVRPDHPAIIAALARIQSASSLALLLRNPAGFTWRYALGVREPDAAQASIVLPAPDFGTLVHDVLERAVVKLEETCGLARADADEIQAAITAACKEAAAEWSAFRGAPPQVVWRRTLLEVQSLAAAGLAARGEALPGQTSHAEVPFGGQTHKAGREVPWDPGLEVTVPTTPFRIGGYIDRLDLADDGSAARVVDYKTGRVKPQGIVLDGGRELQRCLYAYAVASIMGADITVEAELAYLRGPEIRRLEGGDEALLQLVEALRETHARLKSGVAVPGIDAGGERDDLRFALPANAAGGYCRRKATAAKAALGQAAAIWEAA